MRDVNGSLVIRKQIVWGKLADSAKNLAFIHQLKSEELAAILQQIADELRK